MAIAYVRWTTNDERQTTTNKSSTHKLNIEQCTKGVFVWRDLNEFIIGIYSNELHVNDEYTMAHQPIPSPKFMCKKKEEKHKYKMKTLCFQYFLRFLSFFGEREGGGSVSINNCYVSSELFFFSSLLTLYHEIHSLSQTKRSTHFVALFFLHFASWVHFFFVCFFFFHRFSQFK